MKVFPMTPEQQQEAVTLQAAVKEAAKPYQEAQAAYRKFLAIVTGGNQFQRSQITDDGTQVVVQ